MLVQHILTTYAQISQPDLDDNMTEFNIGINSGLHWPFTHANRRSAKSSPLTRESQSPTN